MATPKASRALRWPLQAISVAVLLAATAACNLMPVTGVLAEGKAWAATCPDGTLASFVAIDVSQSVVLAEFSGQPEQVLRDVAARTATCAGHLRVVAFAGSSAGTFELYDGPLSLPGATDNARWRRLPEIIDSVTDDVADHYQSVVDAGPPTSWCSIH